MGFAKALLVKLASHAADSSKHMRSQFYKLFILTLGVVNLSALVWHTHVVRYTNLEVYGGDTPPLYAPSSGTSVQTQIRWLQKDQALIAKRRRAFVEGFPGATMKRWSAIRRTRLIRALRRR